MGFAKTVRLSLTALWVPVLLGGFPITGCGKTELNSRWLDREINIDGDTSEWNGVLTPLEDIEASVGCMNDEKSFYMCLYTRDPGIRRQITAMGLKLWFDPQGGEEKYIGIHYPLGLRQLGKSPRELGRRPSPGEPDAFRKELAETLGELEILGPYEGGRREFPVTGVEGVEVLIHATEMALIYELRLPLAQVEGLPFSIGSEPGMVVGVGLETPQMERRMPPRDMRGGLGMEAGREGGGPGGGGGRMGGMRPEGMKSLSFWAKVRLATAETNSAPR